MHQPCTNQSRHTSGAVIKRVATLPTDVNVLHAGGYSANYTEILNLAEKYDPNTNAWTSIASMPTPRGDVMCAALNGQYVAAGGYYDPTLQFIPASFRAEVQAYNPATGERFVGPG